MEGGPFDVLLGLLTVSFVGFVGVLGRWGRVVPCSTSIVLHTRCRSRSPTL